MVRLAPGILALVAALSVVGTSAWAATGTLTGSVSGVPAGSSTEGVEAVNNRGEIGAVGTLNASGTYSLKVPAGTWVTAADALSAGKSLSALAAPVVVRAGHRSHAHGTRVKPQVSAARAGALPRGAVVTMTPITMLDLRTAFVNHPDYTATVLNDLFRLCSARGIIFADTSAAFQKFARQESALSLSGRLSVPFDYHPIKPQYKVVTFQGFIDPGSVGIGLAVERLDGDPVAMNGIDGTTVNLPDGAIPTDQDVVDVFHQADASLAAPMCGA